MRFTQGLSRHKIALLVCGAVLCLLVALFGLSVTGIFKIPFLESAVSAVVTPVQSFVTGVYNSARSGIEKRATLAELDQQLAELTERNRQLEATVAQMSELQKENDRLRGLLGQRRIECEDFRRAAGLPLFAGADIALHDGGADGIRLAGGQRQQQRAEGNVPRQNAAAGGQQPSLGRLTHKQGQIPAAGDDDQRDEIRAEQRRALDGGQEKVLSGGQRPPREGQRAERERPFKDHPQRAGTERQQRGPPDKPQQHEHGREKQRVHGRYADDRKNRDGDGGRLREAEALERIQIHEKRIQRQVEAERVQIAASEAPPAVREAQGKEQNQPRIRAEKKPAVEKGKRGQQSRRRVPRQRRGAGQTRPKAVHGLRAAQASPARRKSRSRTPRTGWKSCIYV